MSNIFADILFMLLSNGTVKIKADKDLEMLFENKCFETLEKIHNILLT